MSLDIRGIKSAIRQWALTASGREVYWSKHDGKQSSSPFISLDLTRIDKKHEDYIGNEVDENEAIDIIGHRTIVINVLVLGGSDSQITSAMQVAHNMKSSLQLPSTQYMFMENDIAIIDETEPRDISFLYTGTSWEKRATFDITFGVAFTNKDNMGYFDTVEITGESYNENNNKIKDSNITVP